MGDGANFAVVLVLQDYPGPVFVEEPDEGTHFQADIRSCRTWRQDNS